MPPPGVDARWEYRLTRDPYPVCHQPRHLFCGYRYDIPFLGVFCKTPHTMDSGRRSFQDPQPLGEGLVFNAVGLYYCLHNEYDPRTGTWLSSDAAGDAWFRLHEYCGNNPLRCNDPAGLRKKMSKEDEEYYETAKARRQWLMNALNAFDYFEEGKRGKFARETFGIQVWDVITLGFGVSDEEWEALEYVAFTEGEQAHKGFTSGRQGGQLAGNIGLGLATGGAGGAVLWGTSTAAKVAAFTLKATSYAVEAYHVGQSGYQTYTAVSTAVKTGEWTDETTASVASFGLNIISYGAAFKGGRLASGKRGNLRGSAREVGPWEGKLMNRADGLQSRNSGVFTDTLPGSRKAGLNKYLWTMDDRGINIALESTPWPTSRGNVVHTNLSRQAYIGGEAWFGKTWYGKPKVTINAGSGRFGDGAGISRAQWNAARKAWADLGYSVKAVRLGKR